MNVHRIFPVEEHYAYVGCGNFQTSNQFCFILSSTLANIVKNAERWLNSLKDANTMTFLFSI